MKTMQDLRDERSTKAARMQELVELKSSRAASVHRRRARRVRRSQDRPRQPRRRDHRQVVSRVERRHGPAGREHVAALRHRRPRHVVRPQGRSRGQVQGPVDGSLDHRQGRGRAAAEHAVGHRRAPLGQDAPATRRLDQGERGRGRRHGLGRVGRGARLDRRPLHRRLHRVPVRRDGLRQARVPRGAGERHDQGPGRRRRPATGSASRRRSRRRSPTSRR
jgi:hypothetical protein